MLDDGFSVTQESSRFRAGSQTTTRTFLTPNLFGLEIKPVHQYQYNTPYINICIGQNEMENISIWDICKNPTLCSPHVAGVKAVKPLLRANGHKAAGQQDGVTVGL